MLKTVGRLKNAQNAQKCFIESMIKRVLIELIIIIIIEILCINPKLKYSI